jgi:hypothetical protein
MYLKIFPAEKWSESEADHSHQTSAEVKEMWIYASISPYTFKV